MARGDEDLISQLPDVLLCLILSYLSTEEAVRTRIVSTRWKHLFTYIPNLDFTYVPNDESPDLFIQFVNSVFLVCNVSLMKSLRLVFHDKTFRPKFFPFGSWIYSAVQRNVQEITISIGLAVPIRVPVDIFSCRTLVTLMLDGILRVALPRSVCLPSLRKCDLIGVCFNDDSARRLFHNCPVLENLGLYECHVEAGVEILDISVPALKSFTIVESEATYQLVLNVPGLLDFNYVGALANEIVVPENLNFLVDASVEYDRNSDTRDNVVVEIVRIIRHAQHLKLDVKLEDFFRPRQIPTFNNLTRLIFCSSSTFAVTLLPVIFEQTPRLGSLLFKQGAGSDDNADSLPEHVPACVTLHLKEVEIVFTGMIYECLLIKYFLKYARNLKKMIIRTKLSFSEECEISSEVCEVVFTSDGVEEFFFDSDDVEEI